MIIQVMKYNKRADELGLNVDLSNGGASVSCDVRGDVSLVNPVFVLRDLRNYYEYNYIYVPLWDRCYFINDVNIDGHLYYLSCTEDVLQSFADDLSSQSFYCLRSSSDINNELTDVFFPTKPDIKTYSDTSINPYETGANNGGMYVIAIASGSDDSDHIGSNTYYLLDADSMQTFMQTLMNTDLTIESISNAIVKTMINPLSYFRSCKWFPFTTSDIENKKTSSKISFGYWDVSCSCYTLNFDVPDDVKLSATIGFTGNPTGVLYGSIARKIYQRFPPFSRWQLVAWPFGIIDIPSSLQAAVIDDSEHLLNADLHTDLISGMGSLNLRCSDDSLIYLTQTCQIGVDIPVGQVVQDYVGSVFNLAQGVSSLATLNVIGAAQGVYSALQSVTPTPSVSGAAGGFVQLMYSHSWELLNYYQEQVYDSTLVGGLCMETKKIGDLSGYAIFKDAACTGTMLKDEKDKIDNLLNSGIFIVSSEG